MSEDATTMRREVLECGGYPVRVEVVRSRAHDHPDRKKPATDHTLAGRLSDPEPDIDAIQHPVADTVIELNVGLDAWIRPTEFIEQRHQDRHKRRLRSHDAQRTRY